MLDSEEENLHGKGGGERYLMMLVIKHEHLLSGTPMRTLLKWGKPVPPACGTQRCNLAGLQNILSIFGPLCFLFFFGQVVLCL